MSIIPILEISLEQHLRTILKIIIKNKSTMSLNKSKRDEKQAKKPNHIYQNHKKNIPHFEKD